MLYESPVLGNITTPTYTVVKTRSFHFPLLALVSNPTVRISSLPFTALFGFHVSIMLEGDGAVNHSSWKLYLPRIILVAADATAVHL